MPMYTDSVDNKHEEKEANAKMVQHLTSESSDFDSPININIDQTTPLEIPELKWVKHSLQPQKMKLTNSGQTLIVSGKWFQVRPYIKFGPLNGLYVFSQLHFHWGADNTEGSEHTIDGSRYPLEMHVVYFKSVYKTQKEALEEKDGIVVLVYLYQIQKQINQGIQFLIDAIPLIQKPYTGTQLDPAPLSRFVPRMYNDYFLYWGAVTTNNYSYLMLWLVSRTVIGISQEQMDKFHTLIDMRENPLIRNYRSVLNTKRRVFHINPSPYTDATLYPVINETFYSASRGIYAQSSIIVSHVPSITFSKAFPKTANESPYVEEEYDLILENAES